MSNRVVALIPSDLLSNRHAPGSKGVQSEMWAEQVYVEVLRQLGKLGDMKLRLTLSSFASVPYNFSM